MLFRRVVVVVFGSLETVHKGAVSGFRLLGIPPLLYKMVSTVLECQCCIRLVQNVAEEEQRHESVNLLSSQIGR